MAHIGNSPASYFTAVTTDVFSANGTATAFTLSKYVSNPADLEIVVNNIQQNPFSNSYSVSNNTLTFSEAPLAGSNNIVVTYRQATIGSTIPTPNTVGNNALQRDLSFTGNTTTQHLVPAANITYDIGTSTMRYRDIYLSGNTINLGDIKLSTNGTSFSVANATGGVFASALGNTTITGTLSASANVNLDSGTLFVDGTNNRVGINNTAPTQSLTVTGTTSLTGNLTVQGVITANSNASIPVLITSTAIDPHLQIAATNATSTYSYLQLSTTDAGQGHGYLIKNGNNGGNGLANGSLCLWNADGSNTAIEFVTGGTIGNRSSVYANGSFIVRGNIGVGNTTPFNTQWGSNSDCIAIGGGKAYGVLHLNGKSSTNTSWSTGVGDGIYYMAYDNIATKHHIQVNSGNGIQFPYQLHIHGTPGNGTRGSAGIADRFATSYNRGTLSFSNSRITVPLGGLYLIVFQTICDAGSGRIDTDIRVNGTQVVTGLNNASDGNADYRMRTHTCVIQLAASDYIQFYSGNWYEIGNSYGTWGTASVTLIG